MLIKVVLKAFMLFFVVALMSIKVLAASLNDMQVLTDEYPPFNYKNEQGELKGVAVELLIQAYKEAGLVLDRERFIFQPWPRSYKQVQSETDIILLSMTRTAEREKLFQWVGPITTTRIGLIAKKSRQIKIEKAKDIEKFIIGGNPSNIGVQLVNELLGDKADVRLTPHPESLVKMLNLDRFDLWAYEEASAKLVFERFKLNPDDYESVYTLKESELYYALNLNTDKRIVRELQQAIDNVRAKLR